MRRPRLHAASVSIAALLTLGAAAIATPAQAAPAVPGAPTLAATSTGDTLVTWTDTSTTESGFVVERCTGISCSSYATVGWVGRNATSFTDAGAPSSFTPATYRIRSFDHSGYSTPSPSATYSSGGYSTLGFIYPPTVTVDAADPNVVHADASQTVGLVYRYDDAGNLVSFQPPVRWISGSGDTAVTTTAQWSTSFDVAGTYAIAARPAEGPRSIGAGYATVPGHAVTTPINLTGTAGRSSVALRWGNFPTAATSVEVWRCNGTTTCTTTPRKVTTLGIASTTATASSLRSNTAYRFWIRTVRTTDGASATTTPIQVTTLR